jgi:PBP1b-binding outer membrane lipoprotein LpoB
MKTTILLILAALVLTSCTDPVMNPNASKAITEIEQLKEQQRQTAVLVIQAQALERIAKRLESMPTQP